MSSAKAAILGIGMSVPDRVMTNADLEKMVDTSDEWITTRTGISERRIAAPSEATSDLASAAAQAALSDAGITALDVDALIVATITPDMPFPATACIVQDRIGASNAAAFDISAGCSGFIYALSLAKAYIESSTYSTILVVGAEVLSRFVDWTDRSTCVLFGDGAGAVVIGAVGEGAPGSRILGVSLGSDGSGARLLHVPAGGSVMPASEETLRNRLHFMSMCGNQVYKFATRIIGDAALDALRMCGLSKEDIDCFIPHQANMRIIDAAARKLDLPIEKVFVNLDRYGNTSAASVPIALYEARERGFVKAGDVVVLVGFGAGLTWGGAVVRW
jgi:3-oxoacyl-[acyl-carrier-protein] synthase-3